MSQPHVHEQKIPRGVLIGAAVLIALTFVLAASGRSSLEAERNKPLPPALQSLELRFEDRAGGAVGVIEVMGEGQSREITELAPNTNGFVRGVLRSMVRARKLESMGRDGTFTLARQADGRITLEDHKTGRRLDLNAFGPDNTAAFVALLDAGRRASR